MSRLSFGRHRLIWCVTVRKAEKERSSAIVLLSGGLDSTVSLALCSEYCRLKAALFFDYGQHASLREEDAARRTADHFKLSFERIELPWMGRLSSSVLIAGKGEPRELSPEDLDKRGRAYSLEVWVENRNAVFINIAAAYAAANKCGVVIVGFNREEAANFPDNSEEFLRRMNESLELGVGKPVRVESPTISMTKREIAGEGLRLCVPWNLIWSCYRGGDVMCGRCESCLRLKRAVSGTPAEAEVRFGKERH